MSEYLVDGWISTTLGEVVITGGLQTGPFGSQLKASEYAEVGIPVVMPSDLNAYRIVTDSIARIPEVRARDLSRHRLKKGDIVFGRRGEIGRCALVTEREDGWICGTGCLRARLSPQKALPDFIINHLDLAHTTHWLNANAVGQTMLNLNTFILAALPLCLPPLPEQRKIAEILRTWDEAIALVERLIAALKERKRGLMQRLLLLDDDESAAALRFPGSVEAWRYEPLGQIFNRITRKNDKGCENVLTASGQRGLVSQTDYFNKSVAGASLEGYYLINRGDFAYNRSSSSGYPYGAIKQLENYEEGILSTLYLCFGLARDEDCDAGFFRHFFEAGGLNRGIYMIAQEGARNHGLLNVSIQDFFNLRVPVPPIEEQRQLARFFDELDRELNHARQLQEKLTEQKRGLMQRLLTGEVRVRVEEAPA
jgi:type I restriction enzyme, S subunit